MKNVLTILIVFFSIFNNTFAAPPDCSKFLTSEDIKFIENYISLLKDGKSDDVLALSSANLKTTFTPIFGDFKILFDGIGSSEKVMIDCRYTTFTPLTGEDKTKHVIVSYQWNAKSSWPFMSFGWTETNGQRIVDQFDFKNHLAPLEKQNAFTLEGKSSIHWLFLFINLLIVIFIGYVIFIWFRTDSLKYKWLWLALILVGAGRFSINWATGEFGINPFFIQLNPISFSWASDYTPIIASVSLPIGALLLLIKIKGLYRLEEKAPKVLVG